MMSTFWGWPDIFFSLLFSFAYFGFEVGFVGMLYFVRLVAYSSLFLVIYDLVRKESNLKTFLFNSLIIVITAIAIMGWFQYFIYPDIRNFVVWGWDDHLYRLFSTFIDPGFTSILLVFGFLLTLNEYLRTKNRYYILLLLFLFITIGFTYSRAGYLALFAGILAMLIYLRKVKYIAAILIMFVAMIFILPKPASSGVELQRVFSVVARIENYKETFSIWQKTPIFGVGYNNLCFARIKYLGNGNFSSHSCSGSDSSLLGLLATGGILGLTLFLVVVWDAIKNIDYKTYGLGFLACLVALFIHSLFVNSLFYPWVMGFMATLAAVSLKS